jgi:undecaprenyl-diphosphatase
MVSTKPKFTATPFESENAFSAMFDQLDGLEIETVRRHTKRMEIGIVRGFALGLNHLSNGMLYPIVAVWLFLVFGRAMTPALGVAAASIAAAHICYPIIKSHFARNRPFVRDPSIPSLLKPLDRYSFPSGHTMTATAAFVPICMTLPSLAFAGVAAVLLIGWARLGAGHHYPSDVLAGVLLGGLCASPGLFWLLA